MPHVESPVSPPPPPAPRPVPRGAVAWNASFLLLFGGIWAAVGLLVFLVFTAAGGPFWNDWILDRRGVRVDAQPLAVEPTNARVNGRRVYEIRFSFADRDGKAQRGSVDTTEGALLAGAREGRLIPVEYDPEAPARTRLAGGSASLFGKLGLLPLAFFVIGAVLFLRGRASRRRTRELYRDGEAAPARVVAVEATASRQNRVRLMRMEYELEGPTGIVRGSWKTLRPAPVGAAIWVIYDRAEPERSMPAEV